MDKWCIAFEKEFYSERPSESHSAAKSATSRLDYLALFPVLGF